MFSKGHSVSKFSKNAGSPLLGAVKGVAGLLDNSTVGGAITLVAPEIGAGLAVAKKFGLLEKVKNM